MSRWESLLTHSEWEKWGEVPHDYVLLREDAVVGEQELIEFCRARLALQISESGTLWSLPKTSTSKIRRNALRQQSRAAGEGAS